MNFAPQPFLLVSALLLALAWTGGAMADVIVATAGPMTGTNAAFGEEVRRGAELAVEDINAAGGVNGQPIQVNFIDTESKLDQYAADAQQVLDKGSKPLVEAVLFIRR